MEVRRIFWSLRIPPDPDVPDFELKAIQGPGEEKSPRMFDIWFLCYQQRRIRQACPAVMASPALAMVVKE